MKGVVSIWKRPGSKKNGKHPLDFTARRSLLTFAGPIPGENWRYKPECNALKSQINVVCGIWFLTPVTLAIFSFSNMSGCLWIKVLMFSAFSWSFNSFLALIVSDVTSSAMSSLNMTSHAPYWISLHTFTLHPTTDSHSMSTWWFECLHDLNNACHHFPPLDKDWNHALFSWQGNPQHLMTFLVCDFYSTNNYWHIPYKIKNSLNVFTLFVSLPSLAHTSAH